MTLEQILTALQRAAPGDALDLAADAFGAGALERLLSTYFVDGRMRATLTELAIDAARGHVVAAGIGTAAPLDKTKFTAYFRDDGTGVQMTLAATPAAGWTFSSSFPPFAQSFADALAWSSFALALDSRAHIEEGLTVEAVLDMAGPHAWLFGSIATVPLAGAVAIEHGVPTFAFVHAIEQPFSVGTLRDVALTFAFRAVAVSAQVYPPGGGTPKTEWGSQATLGCYGTVPLGRVTATLSIGLSIASAALVAQLQVQGEVGLGDLAALVHDAPLESNLPSESLYNPGSTFAAAAITAMIDSRRRAISAIVLALDAAPRWPLYKGTELRDIRFELQVTDPLTTRRVTAALTATIAWPGGVLRVGGTAPQVMLFAVLEDGSAIPLGQVLDRLLPTAVPEHLVVDELAFQIVPAQGAFDLTTGISGGWSIPLGPVDASLERAWMSLSRRDGQTSGSIAATATIGAFTIDGRWSIPGAFALTGRLNRVQSLDTLIRTLTTLPPPEGVPDILITAATAGIVIAPDSLPLASSTYTFYATASATTASIDLGTVWFAVRREGRHTGFLAGFVVPATWSPGDLLPALKPLFDSLSFTDTGLLVSSVATDFIDIPILKQRSLPTSVKPGIVAFAGLRLKGGGLDLLGKLFSGDVVLNLLAQLDMRTPANSTVEARLRAIEAHGALRFIDFRIAFAPAATTFTVSASARLEIGAGQVTVTGAGSVTMTPPAATLSLLVQQWREPFGIEGLTIESFGIGFTFSGSVAINFLGHFLIGTKPRQFRFTIGGGMLDFEVPSALLFGLDATDQTLMLADLVEAFTHLDLASVPVLRDIGFRRLDFAIVDDPAGFTIGSEHFPPGIRITADLTLYEWNVHLDLAVNTGRGIYAKGGIDEPIVVGSDVLVIADEDGGRGPSLLIDTAAFATGAALVDRTRGRLSALPFEPPLVLAASATGLAPMRAETLSATYLQMDASVSLLGVLRQAVKISVSRDTFDFSYRFAFFGIEETLSCFLSAGQKRLAASAEFEFALDVDLPAVTVEGVSVFPAVSLHAPRAGLALGLSLAWSSGVSGDFRLAVGFDWHGLHLDFTAEITLADIGNALERLGDALLEWMRKNARKVWEKIIGNVDAYLEAIRDELIAFADGAYGVAKAMIALFESSVEEVARALRSLGYAFVEAAEALANAFGISFDAAAAVFAKTFEMCSLSAASALLYSPHTLDADPRFVLPARVLVDLAQRPSARDVLIAYYAHAEDWQAVAATPHGRRSLASLAAATQDGSAAFGEALLAMLDGVAARDSERHAALARWRADHDVLAGLTYRQTLALLHAREAPHA
ncbi:hypothetical protein [Sorangium sp. So ce394]|uniref:hypothetical protein n=1 Tax=Sorangium sp. So ce394 TaxID=3133310 RepID=UPI003F5B2555